MQVQVSLKVMPSAESRSMVYDKVNEVIKMIEDSGLKYVSGPSETTVEGDYDEVFALVRAIQFKLVADGVDQITMVIMTDYNKDNTYIDEKIENVQTYLAGAKHA